MSEARQQSFGAASGLAALATGIAGGALEREWPSAVHPFELAEFIALERSMILAQSMLFVLSAGLFMWFLGTLRGWLFRAEGGDGRLATVAFGSGYVWAALTMVGQALQIGLAMGPDGDVEPGLIAPTAAVISVANLPMAVMLVAVAVTSFRHAAFPAWLAWIALATAASELLLFFGTFARSGPLAPTGFLAYVLYPAFALWLVPTALVMMKRGDRRDRRPAPTPERRAA